jgi:predicted Holliday junction resolvase-like endonuclease
MGQIQREKRFFATCPSCAEDFRLDKAILFHARGPLPEAAKDRLLKMKVEVKQRREDLALQRKRASKTAEVTAESVNVGKIVEKIAPSFSTFKFAPRDCRALLEPIDYVVFSGLSNHGRVDRLHFVEVKSRGATLKEGQRKIRDAIEGGKVSLEILPRRS